MQKLGTAAACRSLVELCRSERARGGCSVCRCRGHGFFRPGAQERLARVAVVGPEIVAYRASAAKACREAMMGDRALTTERRGRDPRPDLRRSRVRPAARSEQLAEEALQAIRRVRKLEGGQDPGRGATRRRRRVRERRGDAGRLRPLSPRQTPRNEASDPLPLHPFPARAPCGRASLPVGARIASIAHRGLLARYHEQLPNAAGTRSSTRENLLGSHESWHEPVRARISDSHGRAPGWSITYMRTARPAGSFYDTMLGN